MTEIVDFLSKRASRLVSEFGPKSYRVVEDAVSVLPPEERAWGYRQLAFAALSTVGPLMERDQLAAFMEILTEEALKAHGGPPDAEPAA